MPKLTPEREKMIIDAFKKDPNYSNVAKEVGVDPRTVRQVIAKDRARKEESAKGTTTNSSSGIAGSGLKGISKIENPVETDKYKLLYGTFVEGKKPPEIIAETGLDPRLVENEYARFSRQRNSEITDLQKKVLAEFNADTEPELAPYLKSFRSKGFPQHYSNHYIPWQEKERLLGHQEVGRI